MADELSLDPILYYSHRTGVTSPELRIRKAQLAAQREFDAFLTYYPAGLQQRAHEHDCAQFSLILAGSLVERVEGREHAAGPGQASAKPSGIAHADSYGPQGAVLLSFHFRCEATARQAIGHGDWHWRLPGKFGSARCFNSSGPVGRADMLWDVLSATGNRTPGDTAPEWLRWARAELDHWGGLVDIGDLAIQAGVHRVHFSREFARHYGLVPSAYRQRQMAARAVRALVDDGQTAASAAQDAGFADQSHMIRAIRSAFGTTPRRIAALFRH
jgi:AraC family transcriptional regulator